MAYVAQIETMLEPEDRAEFDRMLAGTAAQAAPPDKSVGTDDLMRAMAMGQRS